MTEEEACDWLDRHFDVPRETWGRLERYVEMLLAESDRQNLIAASTRNHVWSRHIVDSAQLLLHVPEAQGKRIWVDLGAGAGLPGMVVALLSGYHVAMIEMRRKRVAFLQDVIEALGLSDASAIFGKVERVKAEEVGGIAAVISARAYAPMERLIPSARHLTDSKTIWMLPKGQNYQNELEIARRLWHSEAHIEQSVTAPDSAILMLGHGKK
tara:strand:+ start:71426 stop:72061 length:636 start_codon:yes stop_codon:yes gene_type:complete